MWRLVFAQTRLIISLAILYRHSRVLLFTCHGMSGTVTQTDTVIINIVMWGFNNCLQSPGVLTSAVPTAEYPTLTYKVRLLPPYLQSLH